MRPDAKVWRKHQRATQKGVPTGRRTTHQAETQQPQPTPRATGYACHVGSCTSWNASPHSACGTVYACPTCWAGIERLTAIYQAEDTAGAA